jgi:hypothetical protein
MVLATGLALCAVLAGALITYSYDEDASLGARLCVGAPTGLAALGLLGFAVALSFGLTASTLQVTFGAAVALSLLLVVRHRTRLAFDIRTTWWRAGRSLQSPTLRDAVSVTFYGCVLGLVWVIFSGAMRESVDGISTDVVHNLGDLPFHLSIISGFAYGDNLPPENPIFAGTRLTYPILADVIAAFFVRLGASFGGALRLENLLLAVSLVGLLHRWALELTRDRLAALVTPLLLVLSGGLGWWLLIPTVWQSDRDLITTLTSLDRDFTMGDGLRWGNAVTTLLVPQRAFLLGLPLAIVVFTLWWKATGELPLSAAAPSRTDVPAPSGADADSMSRPLASPVRLMVAAGAVAGLLPLAHAHSFAVVMVSAAWLAVFVGPWRPWLVFCATATALALPQIFWLMYGSSTDGAKFLGWHVGWDRGDQNLAWFWFVNTGFVIPLVTTAFVVARRDVRLTRILQFYLPFILWFVIPNLVKLSPWIWDNIKVLFYWYVASTPIVAVMLARLWRIQRVRLVAPLLVISLTLSGALDIWRVVTRASEQKIFSSDDVAFAEQVRQITAPHSRILHAPTYNHPVFLTGRRSLMGYPGHLWSHGIDYGSRETDLRKIYTGNAQALSLMTRYSLDYAVIGPSERSLLSVNEAFFSQFQMVASVGPHRLYRVAPTKATHVESH